MNIKNDLTKKVMYWLSSIIKYFEERSDTIIRCSTLDVRCSVCSISDIQRSSFKTIPYGIHVTRKRLQKNLARMGALPLAPGSAAFSTLVTLGQTPGKILVTFLSGTI